MSTGLLSPRFFTQVNKVPEHSRTCNRVEVRITAEGVVHDSTVMVIADPDPP